MDQTQNYNRTPAADATGLVRVLGAFFMILLLYSGSAQAHDSISNYEKQRYCQIPGESVVLKVLINHLMELLGPSSLTQLSTAVSLEDLATQLISSYQTSPLRSSLTSEEVTKGLADCQDALLILSDPGASLALSTATALDLVETVSGMKKDLEDVN